MDKMEITQFISSRRERALLDSDYSTYRKQLTKRLLTVRRKLQYTSSAKGKKYAAKPAVEAQDINQNHECVAKFRLMIQALTRSSGMCTCFYSQPKERGHRRCT